MGSPSSAPVTLNMEPPPPSAPTTLHDFKRLPIELRLKIWEDAIPDPRVIDLKLLNSHNQTADDPSPEMEDWQWTYKPPSEINHVALSQVNRESREVYLKTYQRTDLFESLGGFTRKLYVDFSRDILYRNCWIYDFWSNDLSKLPDTFAQANSKWAKDTELLAVRPSILRPWSIGGFGTIEERTEQTILNLIASFPKLKHLRLIIDGRGTRIPGPHEIVELPDAGSGSDSLSQKVHAETALAKLLEHIKEQNPSVSIPRTELALLINGKDHPGWERRWNYSSSKCEVRAVGTSRWEEVGRYR